MLDEPNVETDTPLIETIRSRDIDALLSCLDGNPDLYERAGKHRFPPISVAILNNNLAAIDALIGSGCDIHQSGGVGEHTPLIVAIIVGNIPAMRLLIHAHCDLNLPDSHFGPPITYTIKRNKFDVVKLFSGSRQRVNAQRSNTCVVDPTTAI